MLLSSTSFLYILDIKNKAPFGNFYNSWLYKASIFVLDTMKAANKEEHSPRVYSQWSGDKKMYK